VEQLELGSDPTWPKMQDLVRPKSSATYFARTSTGGKLNRMSRILLALLTAVSAAVGADFIWTFGLDGAVLVFQKPYSRVTARIWRIRAAA
jgi:hypothetical protein